VKVADWMDRGHPGVSPATTLGELLVDLLRHNLNGVAVVDGRAALLGIVTLSDLRRQLLPSPEELHREPGLVHDLDFMERRFRQVAARPVDSVMTRDVATIGPSQPLLQAGAILNARRVKQLPVVERGHLVGMISPRDIAWAFLTASRPG